MWGLLKGEPRRRLAWIGAAGLVSVSIVSAVLLYVIPGKGHVERDPAGRLRIQAKCALASGQGLAADSVTIACGLDKAEIEASIREAAAKFDLNALVEQIRKGEGADPTALEALGKALGLTHEAVMSLLAMLSTGEPEQWPLIGRFEVPRVKTDGPAPQDRPNVDGEGPPEANKPAVGERKNEEEPAPAG